MQATVTTRQNRLNVRNGPSISNTIVGKLEKGQTVDIGAGRHTGDGWTWVEYNGNWICQIDPRLSYPLLNITGTETVPVPEPPEPVPEPPVVPDYNELANNILGNITQTTISPDSSEGIDGSAVMYENEKYNTDRDDGFIWLPNKYTGEMSQVTIESIERESPKYVQNKTGFPYLKGFNRTKGYYEYNYYMDYDKDLLSSDLISLRKVNNLSFENRRELYIQNTEYYNRYKLANPNDVLAKSFAHVFFVRPDCNVLERASGNKFRLPSGLENSPNYLYAFQKEPELLKQLISDSDYGSDFMMFLSNKAKSFQLSDEYIGHDTYGKALTGHKVAYGKSNTESKSSGDFSIHYTDDRDLHVFHLHKLWVDYISKVYHGEFDPQRKYMINRILDYATSVYYILTAEDGETIIFWSKYYGVFPITIPSSQYSWSSGEILSSPSYDVRYQYSWKEDFNPLSLNEFNINSGEKNYHYLPTISSGNYMSNSTWVGAPFIETFNNESLSPYTFKLRFRKGNI